MKRLMTMLTRHRLLVAATLAMSAGAWGAAVAQDDDPLPPTREEAADNKEQPPPPVTPGDAAAADKAERRAAATEVDTLAADKENGDQPEVLARGPIHEAFAESVVFDPKPGLIIHKKPPADVPEIPPEQKPDEPDTVWIPGYWAWDDDRDDFLWVSGIWRRIPQGRQWISGYWADLPDDAAGEGDRYQWVAGRWASTDEDEVEYLPPPPPTLEEGPNVPAPSDDYVWQPGIWMWSNNQYNWRGGFWAASNPNWLWVPPYYSWTPRGYLYNTGYWDYGWNRRGICFAPVYFNSPFYLNSGYYYSPFVAFNSGLFNQHLFCRPGYNHYYFGDYYASRYQQGGIYPWFAYHNRRYGYDPFYANARVRMGASNPDWNKQLMADFQSRRDHVNERPPHTFAQMKQQAGAGNGPGARDAKSNMFLASLDAMAKGGGTDAPKFTSLNNEQRRDVLKSSEQWNQWRSDRRSAETAADVRERAAARQRAAGVAGKGKNADPSALKSDRAKMPKSPFASNVAPQGKGNNRQGDGRIQMNKPNVPDDLDKGKTGNRPTPRVNRQDNDDHTGLGPKGIDPGSKGASGRPESKVRAPKGGDSAPRFQGPEGGTGPGRREPNTTPPKGTDSAPRFQGPEGGAGPNRKEPNTPGSKGGAPGAGPKIPGAGGGGGAGAGGGNGPGAGGQRPPNPGPRLNVPNTPSVPPRVTPNVPSTPRIQNTPAAPRVNAPSNAPRINAPSNAPSGPRIGGGGVGGGGAGGGGGGGPRGGGGGGGGGGPRGGGGGGGEGKGR